MKTHLKYFFVFVIVLFKLLSVFCQHYSTTQNYNSSYTRYGASIEKDGTVFVAGTIADTLAPYKNLALFSKIDTTTGEYVEYKTYSLSPSNINIQENCFVIIPDNRFATGGSYNYNNKLLIMLHDSMGAVIDTTIIEDTTAMGFYSKYLLYKDSALYFLITRQEPSFDANLWLIKLNLDAEIIWTQVYGIPSLTEIAGSLLDLDSTILITSARSTLSHVPNTVEDDSHTWLFTIDTAGVLQNEWLDPDGRTYWPDKMLKLENNKVVMVGGYRRDYDQFNGVYWNGYVAQFDLNTWSKDWWKDYGNTTNVSYFHDVDTVAGGYILTGQDAIDTPIISNPPAGWLMKVNMNGDKVWEVKYLPFPAPSMYNCSLRETHVLPSGDFISVGWADNSQYHGWVLRTDSAGCVLPDCEYVGIDNIAPEFNFTVFPNPTEDVINISIENLTEADMDVYDLLGKRIFSKRIKEGISSFSLQDFATGMYVVVVKNNNRILGSRKVIIQ